MLSWYHFEEQIQNEENTFLQKFALYLNCYCLHRKRFGTKILISFSSDFFDAKIPTAWNAILAQMLIQNFVRYLLERKKFKIFFLFLSKISKKYIPLSQAILIT